MTSPTGASTFAPRFETDAIVGQAKAENFPVASVFLPRRVRGHLLAIYGFARFADDIGDESEGDRLGQLDWLESELERAATGSASHPLLQQLTPTIKAFDLSLEPFRALIEANRQDQTVTRYETMEELVGYCRLSAVPVGRLVLAIFGVSTADREALADEVCIGLQLTEHLQDVAEDAGKGRIYVPLRDLRSCGVAESDLLERYASPAVQRLIAVQVNRARCRLVFGRALAASLPWQPRVAVAGFTAGGLAALDAIQDANYDVLSIRCHPRRHRVGMRLVGTLLGSSIGLPGIEAAA